MRSLLASFCFGFSTLWLGSSLALAQTSQVTLRDPSRGVTLLPTSVSFVDEATSLSINPAGLHRAGALSAMFVHERSNVQGSTNSGLFLSAALARRLGAGLSVEWLRPQQADTRVRTVAGLSLGSDVASLGASLVWQSGGPASQLTSVDLGAQWRVCSGFSLGATVRNLNTPSNAALTLSRSYALGLGLRPLGEKLTLGVDAIVDEQNLSSGSRMQYSLKWMALNGVSVLAGASHGFGASVPIAGHAGLQLDLENVGYTQGLAFADGRLNWQFAARLSTDKYLSFVPQQKVALVSLGGMSSDSQGTLGALLGLTPEDRFLKLLHFLERAENDSTLAGVVLRLEGLDVGLGRAQELHRRLQSLRSHGKRVLAYALSMSDTDYLVASAAEKIVAAPSAMLMVDGLKSSVQFVGGTAELLGVTVDVARVGPYKNYPDQFTRTEMSAEQREAVSALLDHNVKQIESTVTAARSLSKEQLQQAIDTGLKSPPLAQQLHEIDAVMTPDQFESLVRRTMPEAQIDVDYQPFDTRSTRWREKQKIAVVPVLGSIVGGRSQDLPLAGQLAGASSFASALSAAVADPTVKAIVLRVDSGGGDALASDLMYRAVLEAKKRKPVFASMGDVAASGGYYVAMGAEEIFASPTTVTGSIGIFYVKPAFKNVLQAAGISQDTVRRGKLAGINDLVDPWTDAQRDAVQAWVNAGYDTFISEVASSRKMTKAQVDEIGKGRVWSGTAAKEKGLVDTLGGLFDAVAKAQKRVGLSASNSEVVYYSSSSGIGLELLSAAAPTALLELQFGAPWPPFLKALEKQVGAQPWMMAEPGLQARVEYDLRFE
jgi:protease IV